MMSNAAKKILIF